MTNSQQTPNINYASTQMANGQGDSTRGMLNDSSSKASAQEPQIAKSINKLLFVVSTGVGFLGVDRFARGQKSIGSWKLGIFVAAFILKILLAVLGFSYVTAFYTVVSNAMNLCMLATVIWYFFDAAMAIHKAYFGKYEHDDEITFMSNGSYVK